MIPLTYRNELIRLHGELTALRILIDKMAENLNCKESESDEYGATLSIMRCAFETLEKLDN